MIKATRVSEYGYKTELVESRPNCISYIQFSGVDSLHCRLYTLQYLWSLVYYTNGLSSSHFCIQAVFSLASELSLLLLHTNFVLLQTLQYFL